MALAEGGGAFEQFGLRRGGPPRRCAMEMDGAPTHVATVGRQRTTTDGHGRAAPTRGGVGANNGVGVWLGACGPARR
jgi:hypothetical protein